MAVPGGLAHNAFSRLPRGKSHPDCRANTAESQGKPRPDAATDYQPGFYRNVQRVYPVPLYAALT